MVTPHKRGGGTKHKENGKLKDEKKMDPTEGKERTNLDRDPTR